MAERIRKAARRLAKPPTSASLRWIYYCCIMFGIVLVFILAGWAWNWYRNGCADVAQLISFWDRLVDAKTLIFIGGVAAWMVDSDRNGIPDKLEKKDGDSDGNVR